MANALYKLGAQAILNGDIDWDTDVIKAALIDTGVYTVNLTTHQFRSSLTGVVGTDVTLASVTKALGVLDAADPTWPAVTGAAVEAIVLYKDTGTPATSPLLVYIDTASAGLPVTPNGGDITVNWNVSGILELA